MFQTILDLWEKATEIVGKRNAVVVLIAGLCGAIFYFGQHQRDKGYASAKKDDSVLIEIKQYQVTYRDGQISKLTAERDTLQNRLNNFDCAKETERYAKLIQNLQAMVSSKKSDVQNSLKIERERTEKMNQILNQ